MRLSLLSTLLLLASGIRAGAQQFEPPKLEPVFSDDFAEDTRADYELTGDVSWERSELKLGEGSSVERVINGGAWTKVRLDLAKADVVGKHSQAELRVYLRMDGATDCYVQLQRKAEGGTGTIALVDILAEGGMVRFGAKEKHTTIREITIDKMALGDVTVAYRRGVVLVRLSGLDSFAGYVENGDATVRAIAISSETGTTPLVRLAAATRKQQEKQYTENERREIAKADAAEGDVISLFQQGNYAEAAKIAAQVLAVRESVLGPQHLDYAKSLGNLATVYASMGEYARAKPLHTKSLDISRRCLGEQHPEYAVLLNNIASLYESIGDYPRAEALYNESLEIRKQVLGEKHPDYAVGLNNLAVLYEHMGDYTRATVTGKLSLDIWKEVGDEHPGYAASLNNLASLYHSLSDYDSAEALYTQAVEAARKALGDEHPNYVRTQSNLASLYESLGDYARAESLYEQTIRIQEKVLGDQHPDYAASLNNLAWLYEGMGDYTRAAPLYKLAGHLERDRLDRSALIQSARQQHWNQRSQRFYLDHRVSNAITLDTPDLVALTSDLWRWKGAVTTRQRAYRQVANSPQLTRLFADLRSVTRKLSVASGQIPLPPARAAGETRRDAYARKHEVWERRVSRLARQREDIEQQIAERSEEIRRIKEPLTVEAIQSRLPEGTAFVDFLEFEQSEDDPRRKGMRRTVSSYLALVVTKGSGVTMLPLGAAKKINDSITDFRRLLTRPESTQQSARTAAQELREELWLPVEKCLTGIDTVVISADTRLGALPFAALPGKTGGYLLEEYKFAFLPLPTLLRPYLDEQTAHPSSEKGLLVLGEVDYDARLAVDPQQPSDPEPIPWLRESTPDDATTWPVLPASGPEVDEVATLFRAKHENQAVTTMGGGEATEAAFMARAPLHRTLHLATHGYFAGEEFEAFGTSPDDEAGASNSRQAMAKDEFINQYMPSLLSGIVLAGANNRPAADDPQADGILTAAEIETLDLSAVDLVVLSACETGLGKTAGGEGLTGLQRAFHIAGARSCVSTLWKVDDRATQELMSRFYHYYWQLGESKIDALRNAQLDLLRDSSLTEGPRRTRAPGDPVKIPKRVGEAQARRSNRSHPRYWAAFQLSGDWR